MRRLRYVWTVIKATWILGTRLDRAVLLSLPVLLAIDAWLIWGFPNR